MSGIDFVTPFQGLQWFWGHESQGVALGCPVLRFQRTSSGSRQVSMFIIAILSLVSGCTYSLHTHNVPSDQTVRIVSSAPQEFVIRVGDGLGGETKDYSVGSNGLANFYVPSLPRGCAVRLFGLVKISDQRPEEVRAIQLIKNDKIVRQFCLDDLAKLPSGENGVREVKIK